MTTNMIPTDQIIIFNDTKIRRKLHNDEWWFVVDVIAALTDSKDPSNYLRNMKRRDPELAKGGVKLTTPFHLTPLVANKSYTVATLDELTDEWKNRGVTESRDFGILTAEICKATFGVTPTDYKEIKSLKNAGAL